MSINSSIYIPRMSIVHTEEYIKYVFKFYNIGTVSYVDFTPIHKKPGFKENNVGKYKSAFVHFSQIETGPVKNFWNLISNGKQQYKLFIDPMDINPKEYWICLKNKNPIQRTMMNIHQVVENGRHLEDLIEEQAKTIQEHSKKIEELDQKLKNTFEIVYHLLGGLFNKTEQRGRLDNYLALLFGRKEDIQIVKDASKWEIWPTTRQGDYCEKKIAEIEEKLLNLQNDLSDYGVLI